MTNLAIAHYIWEGKNCTHTFSDILCIFCQMYRVYVLSYCYVLKVEFFSLFYNLLISKTYEEFRSITVYATVANFEIIIQSFRKIFHLLVQYKKRPKMTL